jgi:plastocyanin
MRTIVVLAALGCLATTISGLMDVDVRGTARVGGQPEPNAVAWLEAPDAPSTTPLKRIALDQRNLTFVPHVLAVRVGTTVEFPNNDRVFHNVFSFRDGKRFDLGTYPVGTRRLVTFDRPGVSRIFCNIHSNMAAYVIALDTPYFAVADESGAFTIPAVPPGSYTYGAWRPGGGSMLKGTFSSETGLLLEIRWP